MAYPNHDDHVLAASKRVTVVQNIYHHPDDYVFTVQVDGKVIADKLDDLDTILALSEHIEKLLQEHKAAA